MAKARRSDKAAARPAGGRARSKRGTSRRAASRPGGASAGPRPDAGQFGVILERGMDLAEVGVGLGVNLVTRLGAIVKSQVFDRILAEGGAEFPGAEAAAAGGGAPRAGQPPVEEEEPWREQPPESAGFFLSNRLPLRPGSPVAISFSINNDSPTSPKRVTVRVEGFTGEARREAIEGGAFTVTPPEKAIEPMDFDKFVLSGAVPAEAVPDTYQGWVIVSDDEEHRIPVFLVVSAGS